jgi:uncharacterized membrane protein
MPLNKPLEIKKSHSLSDKLASSISKVAGSVPFLLVNVAFFAFWLLLNTGVFGHDLIIDKYPFSFLTTTVSIEAILLSTFVIMSQRRAAKLSELRTELDYHSDLKAEVDIQTIVTILQRIAEKQGVDVSDLLTKMKTSETETIKAADRERALDE